MENKFMFFFLLSIVLNSFLCENIERKPLVNDLYTADPSAHVFNGKIYIYPSHDEDKDNEINDNGDQYDMKDYHVYEMTDLETYPKDLGTVLK